MEQEKTYEEKILILVVLILSVLTCWSLNEENQIYDYIVWGSGDLTKILVHHLSNHKVLWIINQSKNKTFINIENSDIKLLCGNQDIHIDHVYFPGIEDFSTFEKDILNNRKKEIIQIAHKKLLESCGERFKNCFYYRFSNKNTSADILHKNAINSIEQHNNHVKVNFDDFSFRKCKKFIFSDTGNIEELTRYFQRSKLEIKLLLLEKTKVENSRKISFSGDTKLEFDTLTKYHSVTLCSGNSIHDLKISNLDNFSDSFTQEFTQTFTQERCFLNLPLKNKNLICLNPSTMPCSQNYIRDYLLMCILAEYI